MEKATTKLSETVRVSQIQKPRTDREPVWGTKNHHKRQPYLIYDNVYLCRNSIAMISKSCKYAFRATIFLASKSEEDVKMSVKEIAAEIEAPQAFTGKVLQILKKHRIINSLKGPYGGFFCEKRHLKLQAIQIVNAIDGLAIFNECILGLHDCSDAHPCPMHNQHMKTKKLLLKSFEETTIADLAEGLNSGNVFITNIEE